MKRVLPNADIKFKPNKELTEIVRSWPKYLRETKATEEWGWKTKYLLKETVADFIKEVQAHPEIYFIIVGQDTDGSVTPLDLGMDWIVAKDKDFIGRRSLFRSDTVRADRKHLVGLLTDDPTEVLPEGSQIVADARARPPVPMLGHVTSSYSSACLGRSIALALVGRGRERMNESVAISLADGRTTHARIASPVFVDPEGKRQHV